MTTLRQFSEKEQNYHAYQARQNYLRQQRTIQLELEQARQERLAAVLREQTALKEKEAAVQEKAAAMQEKAAAIQEKNAALAEIERLKAQLAAQQAPQL